MNAISNTSAVPRLALIGWCLCSVFCFAGRARADTPPPQVTIEPKLTETTPQTAKDLGVNYSTADKSQYNLFKWTPLELRRPYVTDFGVASPITVDAGAFAADVGFGYNYRQNTKNDVQRTLTSWDLGYSTLKLGLLNKLDFEVGIPTWRINDLTLKDSTGQDSTSSSGFGNLMTRFKYNIFGDDSVPPPCTPGSWCCGGVSALSVSADMIWPTATSGYRLPDGFRFQTPTPTQNDNGNGDTRRREGDSSHYEGGLSLQYRYLCGCGCETRVSSGFILSQSHCGDWNFCFGNSIYLGKTFADRYTIYTAFNTSVSTQQRSDWRGEVQAGFTWALTPNTQLNIGSYFGVTDNANDYGPRIHLDHRF